MCCHEMCPKNPEREWGKDACMSVAYLKFQEQRSKPLIKSSHKVIGLFEQSYSALHLNFGCCWSILKIWSRFPNVCLASGFQ